MFCSRLHETNCRLDICGHVTSLRTAALHLKVPYVDRHMARPNLNVNRTTLVPITIVVKFNVLHVGKQILLTRAEERCGEQYFERDY